MTKIEVTVPNDFHIIKDCEYDRDVLRSFKWKWDTKVKKMAAGWMTNDLCLIAGMAGDVLLLHTNHFFYWPNQSPVHLQKAFSSV